LNLAVLVHLSIQLVEVVLVINIQSLQVLLSAGNNILVIQGNDGLSLIISKSNLLSLSEFLIQLNHRNLEVQIEHRPGQMFLILLPGQIGLDASPVVLNNQEQRTFFSGLALKLI
jgi:hypothetical protein